jgi:hypothetical protein
MWGRSVAAMSGGVARFPLAPIRPSAIGARLGLLVLGGTVALVKGCAYPVGRSAREAWNSTNTALPAVCAPLTTVQLQGFGRIHAEKLLLGEPMLGYLPPVIASRVLRHSLPRYPAPGCTGLGRCCDAIQGSCEATTTVTSREREVKHACLSRRSTPLCTGLDL